VSDGAIVKQAAVNVEKSRTIGPGHPAFAEIGLIDPEGPGIAAGQITPGAATRLTPNLRRLTAPNPGFMTGPGTNSYLLGDGDDIAVIDPGPALPDHLAALLAIPGRIRTILVTHTHPDHSPAAALLKEKTGATLMGMSPPLGEHQDQTFQPDRLLADGERIIAGGLALRAIHTPGHASNHLCYLLEQDRILFTGDHVMQGSTVVINPPDGDMTDYIASLRLLVGEPIDYFAPGHGFLIGKPFEMIDLLIRHRFVREGKTLNAVKSAGPATIETLTPIVYDDVPPFKHPWAARSLLAHLRKLERDGFIVERDGAWSPV
jgi:glyoxylase-like metal-dependent hydrolase (beta-lactamase superfamily II)